MRAFFITTSTNETHKHHESFASIPGNEIGCYVYNYRKAKDGLVVGDDLDAAVHAAAKAFAPDLIVYIGACGGNTPSIEGLKRLREIAPTVHFCSDAADDPWWPWLLAYDQAECFDLQVALDGTRGWPLAETQLTALTVVDPARFPAPAPHEARPIRLGFAGNFGTAVDYRQTMVAKMEAFGLQTRKRDQGTNSYPDFVAFMAQCRMVVNFPYTGSRKYRHVKGRVIETGLAGATLLEERGAPTSLWFTPGVDYLEYGSVEEARDIVNRLRESPLETQAMGERLRAKVLAEHRPEKFWGRIVERIGLAVPA